LCLPRFVPPNRRDGSGLFFVGYPEMCFQIFTIYHSCNFHFNIFALRYSFDLNNKTLKILLICLFGLLFLDSFSQENSNIDSLNKAYYHASSPQIKIDILVELTDLLSSSDPDKALDYANQTFELADKNNLLKSKLRAYLQLGDIYWNKSNYRVSLEMGQNAKDLASDLNMDKEYAKSLALLSLNFSNLGDFKKSADFNFQALRIFEELDDMDGISKVYNRIGSDYFLQENFNKALEYYSQSLNIARENKDLEGISRGLNNMAIVYAEMGEYRYVKSNLKESIEINKILDRPIWEGINYSNLGTVYRMEESFDTSYYYLHKAETILTALNSLSNLANAYHGLSLYYFDLGNMDSSLHYAKQTYIIGQENNLKVLVFNAVKQQRQIYQAQNDFEDALKFSLIELQLKDSLDINNTLAKISQLELLYEFDKHEQEIKLIQQRREYVLIIAGTAIVFMLLTLVIIIVTRNRIKAKNEQIERRRLNLELEMRNRELAANVMSLIRKNEILSGMGDKLMKIQNEAVKEETKSAIEKIANELQHTTDKEIWNEFDTRFKQVHGDFYNTLLEQFPDLSPNEQKLCAFLRLNMTTKEVSELTGQRTHTIEIARTRLRKKLGLANTKTNLVTFLSQI